MANPSPGDRQKIFNKHFGCLEVNILGDSYDMVLWSNGCIKCPIL